MYCIVFWNIKFSDPHNRYKIELLISRYRSYSVCQPPAVHRGERQSKQQSWLSSNYRLHLGQQRLQVGPIIKHQSSSIIYNILSGVLNGFCFYWRILRTRCLKISWGDSSPEILINYSDSYRIHLFITAGSPLHDNDAIPAVIALDRFYKVWINKKMIARWGF